MALYQLVQMFSRQKASLKRKQQFTNLHGVISNETRIFIKTPVTNFKL